MNGYDCLVPVLSVFGLVRLLRGLIEVEVA